MTRMKEVFEILSQIFKYPVINSAALQIEFGQLILGVLVFLVGLKLIRIIINKLFTPYFYKGIKDDDTRNWLNGFTSFLLIIILSIISLTIVGFPFSIFGQVWNLTLFTIKDNSVNIGNLILGLILLYPGIKISRYFSGEFQSLVLKRLRLDSGTKKSMEALFRYVLIAIVVLFVLTIVGIPLTAFTLLGGAFAIGIGLGSQNLVNNFLSGIVLMTERPLKIGDIVELEDRRGIVEHIGGRSTRIKTFENVRMVIPNSKLLENTVINWSLIDSDLRREISVGVAYGSPANTVGDLLKQVVSDHPNIKRSPEPVILFDNFGDDALIFRILFWVEISDSLNPFLIDSDVRYKIYEILNAENITIAFPQRDIHLDTTSPLEVSVVKPADLETKD